MKFRVFACILTSIGLSTATPALPGNDPMLGELMMVGQAFCPRGWAKADGQLMSIQAYEALFAIFGTTYGGDGRTTFALPDMRGRVPAGTGQGKVGKESLMPVSIGQRYGREMTQISLHQMPAHSHMATSTATSTLFSSGSPPDTNTPSSNMFGTFPAKAKIYTQGEKPDQPFREGTVATLVKTDVRPAGSGQYLFLHQPSIGITFCVAIKGTFPMRN